MQAVSKYYTKYCFIKILCANAKLIVAKWKYDYFRSTIYIYENVFKKSDIFFVTIIINSMHNSIIHALQIINILFNA